MPLKPYLQVVRLPNVFTAAADSLAGYLLVGGALADLGRWVPLALASMAIYAAGMAFNDVFDYATDLAERPNRPLPSGQVSLRFAAILGAALLVVGLGLAATVGMRPAIVAAALIGCVLAYDGGLKRTPIGPIVMGSCRGLNVALGLSVAADLGGPAAWLVAASLAVFVVGITWISRSETEIGRPGGAVAGMILQDLSFAGLVVAAFRASHFPSPSPDRGVVPLEGLAILGLAALFVNFATGGAIRDPNPRTKQNAVKTGVLSLVWLNFGIVAAVRGPIPALAIAALWLPAFLLGKWWYST